MKNLKIWVKMAVGLGAIIVLIVILSVLSSSLLRKVNTETATLKNEYMPLQDKATTLNSTVRNIPALMNQYLLTGKKESYNKLEETFKAVRRNFADLLSLLDKYPRLNGERSLQALKSYEQLEKTIRASYDVNEQFMALRAEMIKTGAELLKEVEVFVAAQYEVQEEGMRAQSLEELTRVVPLIKEGNIIMDRVNIIRAAMLRSLAEQNRSYAKDNVPVRFPELLKTGGCAARTDSQAAHSGNCEKTAGEDSQFSRPAGQDAKTLGSAGKVDRSAQPGPRNHALAHAGGGRRRR